MGRKPLGDKKRRVQNLALRPETIERMQEAVKDGRFRSMSDCADQSITEKLDRLAQEKP